MTFNCNDVVRLLPTSEFAGSINSSNPVGIEGRVVGVRKDNNEVWYDVLWGNGHGNNYRDCDLEGTMLYAGADMNLLKMLYPTLFKEIDHEQLISW